MEILSSTLIKLEPDTQYIDLSGLLELAKMPNLQEMSPQLLSEEDENKFEEIMPHLCRYYPDSHGNYICVPLAQPYNVYYPSENFWEIEARLRTYNGET